MPRMFQPRQENRGDRPDERPGEEHLLPGHLVHGHLLQLWKQVGRRTRHRHRLEHRDGDVATDDAPGADQRQPGTHTAHQVVVLAASEGQGRGQFAVDQAHQGHDGAADEEGQNGATGTGVFDPAAGQDDPAEADHRTKAEEEDPGLADAAFEVDVAFGFVRRSGGQVQVLSGPAGRDPADDEVIRRRPRRGRR